MSHCTKPILLLLFCLFNLLLNAQNNLDVTYASPADVPDFLNVCGNPDTVKVTVTTAGFSPALRSNISLQIDLFDGVSLVEFLPSANVALTDNTDPHRPVFSLPDLSPNGLSSIEIAFTVRADCGYTDALAADNQVSVFDIYNFTYTFDGQENITETDFTNEYRDAFAVPFYTIEIDNQTPAGRVGECSSREIFISNSSLNGFSESVTYTVLQSEGVFIEELNLGAASVPFTKTLQTGGDTLLTAVISGDLLTGIDGNGDPLFDPGESLTLTENYCLTACLNGTFSTHGIGWGCDDDLCAEMLDVDFVTLGEGAANAQIVPAQAANEGLAGYCQTGAKTLIFTNNGFEIEAGFGAMRNVTAGIGLSIDYLSEHNGYRIFNATIAGVQITDNQALISLDNHPNFTADPDGSGGLTDTDGDGFFDDLPLGESFAVAVEYEFDCSNAQEITGFDEGCTNDFTTTLNGRISWTNNCEETETRDLFAFIRPANNNSDIENFTQTDAFAEEEIFVVIHTERRTVRDFAFNCSAATFTAKVVLPPGINPEINETKLLKNSANEIPLLENTVSNDTLILIYSGNNSPFINGEYRLDLAFSATCDAPLGQTNFPLTFEFSCADCDCTHLWYCGDLTGPRIHNQNPPCSESQTLDCPAGLQTVDFQVNRTNFGFTDADFTQPIDPADANQKIAISCDNVAAEVKNVVGDTPLSDNIGLRISYKNPDNSVDDVDVFDYQTGEVVFVSGGEEFLCSVGANQLTTEQNGATRTLTVDLSACLTGLNLTLTEGDSVNFTGNFNLNPAGPYGTQFTVIPEFRAEGFALVNGTQTVCDNFGENFTVAMTQTAFDFPNNDDFPIGCEPRRLDYRLLTVNNGFSEFFGEELRPGATVDSLVFDFDPNILTAFENTGVEVSIPGHPDFGEDFYDIAPLTDFPGGHYVARFDTLDFQPTLNEVQSYVFNLRVHLTGTCESPTGSSTGNGNYVFSPTIYYRDYNSSATNAPAACNTPTSESVVSTLQYTDPPQLSLTPESAINHILTGDTATWTVQFCNTSPLADATATWLAVEDFSGILEFISLENITDASNIAELPLQPYGADNNLIFTETGLLQRANGLNNFTQICRKIRLKARVNSCENTDFNLRAGYNCQPLAPDWTPADNDNCAEAGLNLSVTLRDPFLEAEVSEQDAVAGEICTEKTLTLRLRNNDQGAAFDLATNIILPVFGAEYVAGSTEIAYPASAAFTPLNIEPEFLGTTVAGNTYRFADFTGFPETLQDGGLPGFNPNNPSDDNELLLRFRIKTDCDFVSGSLVSYNFQGQKACGEATNFEAGETLPLVIEGTQPFDNQLFEINFAAGTSVIPNAVSTLSVEFTNLGTTPTDAQDVVSVTLPEGLIYLGNTSAATTPTDWQIGEPSVNFSGGLQNLTWQMPLGLGENETAIFTFNVNSGNIDCAVEMLDFSLTTQSQSNLFCVETAENCTVATLTSTNGGALQSLPAAGSLSVIFDTSVAECVNVMTEEITVGGRIVSTAAAFPQQDFALDIYFDENANGLIDADEPIVHQVTINGAVTMNNALPFAFTFQTDLDRVCNLLSQLNTSETELCGITLNPLPTPVLHNAGENRAFCADGNTEISTVLGIDDCPTDGTYSYTWTAIAPATVSDLSATDTAQPTLNIVHTGQAGQPDLLYVLATQRADCQTVFDTVTVARGVNPVIAEAAAQQIPPGGTTFLQPQITGGIAPFTYAWSPATGLNNAAAQIPQASPEATTEYTLTVTDANGCADSEVFTVIVANPIDAQISPNVTTLCADENLVLTASGGDNYLWQADPANGAGMLSNFNTAQTQFSGGTAGETYAFSVIVNNDEFPDFTDTASISFEILPAPTASGGGDVLICAGETALLNATFTASPGATVAWSPAVDFGQNNAQAIVSPAQTTTYTFTVTETNGCTATTEVEVIVEDCSCSPAEVTGISVQNSVCGGSEGAVIISTAAPATDYNFVWNTNLGVTNAAGNERYALPFGGYSVRIENATDANCFTEVFVTVENENAVTATAVTTPATCMIADGTATLTPADFDYFWADESTENERTDLAAGTYFVTVTDPTNPLCSNVLSVVIDLENPLSAELNVLTLPTCGNADGAVSLTVNGGSGDYNFSWLSETNVQENIAAGIYQVLISDNETGCEFPFPFALDNDVPNANVTLDAVTDVSCFGDADGAVSFTFMPDADFQSPTDTIISDGLQEFTNGQLPAGDYCLQLLQADGCASGNLCFTVESPAPLSADFVTENACQTPGSITTEISGGTAPYTFLWSDFNANQNRENLLAGSYAVTITDAAGCTQTTQTTISGCSCDLPQITGTNSEATTCGEATGTATIITIEAAETFIYTWSPDIGTSNTTGNSRTNLPAGNYTVQVARADEPSCFSETNVIVNNGDGPAVEINTTAAFCDDANGTATLLPADFSYDWPEPFADAATQNALPAGSYMVTVTEPMIPDCPNILLVTVPEANPLSAEVTVNQQPICEQANGTVTLNVTGGSGNYGYSWPSGTATQTDLTAGLYTVTVTDLNSSDCQLPVLFVLTDDVPQAIIDDPTEQNVSCAGGADGELIYDVTAEPGLPQPLTTIFSNGIQEFENGALPAGNYCVVLRDGNDCVAGGYCFEITEPEPLFISAAMTESCGNDGTIALTVTGGTPSPEGAYTYAWADNATMESTRTGLAPGSYAVTVTDANGCTAAQEIEVEDCGDCDIFGEATTGVFQAAHCDSTFLLCTNLTEGIAEIYTFTDNGTAVTVDILCGENEENLGVNLTIGTHLLVAENTVTGCLDTLNAEVVCTVTDTVEVSFFQFDEGLFCLETDGLFTEFDTLINFCPESSAIDYEIVNDTCLLFNTANIDAGELCLAVCDTVGVCDTTYVNLTILDNNPADIIDTIIVTQTGTVCFDTLMTSIAGEFATMQNLCPEESGQFIDFQPNTNTFCINYEGIALGTDLACIEVCDAENNCDTLNMSLTVVPGEFYYDTLFISAEADTLCLDIDADALQGEIVSVSDACPELNGESVEFLILEEEFCVVYSPLNPGIDTSCVRLEDEFGNITLTNMVITIIETTPEFIVDTIFIAESDTTCLDTSEFLAGIDFGDDDCAENSTGNVDFFFNPVTNCVEYTGMAIGKDTACYFLCDSLGICDTTYFCILVEEFFDPPIAGPDIDTTERSTPVVIDIKANDIIFGGITETTITSEPQYGTAIINPDCSVTYLPDPEFCERSDIFSYEICNENGCDIATVEIFIECLDVRVFNVISPNGDGLNDEFHIANIEGKSGKLEIYNRWGNLVFRSEAYRNNWPGVYGKDKDLPDGTYYYLLEWSDPDTGEEFFQRGYLELRR